MGGGGREREPGSTTPVHLQSLVLLKTGERAKVSDPCSSSLVGSFENTPSVLLFFFFLFLSVLLSFLLCFCFWFQQRINLNYFKCPLREMWVALPR